MGSRRRSSRQHIVALAEAILPIAHSSSTHPAIPCAPAIVFFVCCRPKVSIRHKMRDGIEPGEDNSIHTQPQQQQHIRCGTHKRRRLPNEMQSLIADFGPLWHVIRNGAAPARCSFSAAEAPIMDPYGSYVRARYKRCEATIQRVMAEATSSFVQITGCSRQQASDYLNSTGFDLQRAVRNYFSTFDSQRCPEQRDECALPDSFNVATWDVEPFGMARFVEFIKGLEWPIAFVRNVTIEQVMNFVAPLLVDDYYILIANPSAERHLVCIASKQWPFTRFASRTGSQLGTVDVEVRVQKGAIALVHGALVEDVGDEEAQRELARLLFNTQLMMSFPPAAPTHYITSIDGRDVSVFGQHHAPFEVATSICGTPVPVFFGGPYVPCEAADPGMVFGPMAVYAEQLPHVVCFERAGAGPDQEEERAKGME